MLGSRGGGNEKARRREEKEAVEVVGLGGKVSESKIALNLLVCINSKAYWKEMRVNSVATFSPFLLHNSNPTSPTLTQRPLQ